MSEEAIKVWQDAYTAYAKAYINPNPQKSPSSIAAAMAADKAEIARLREALKPFADCMEWISDDESDEEWAKFRLLVKDYRRARQALETPHAG